MRLLKLDSDGNFSLTKDLNHNIPPYTILSHTWGPDTEEVTFKDITDGTGTSKAGYNKIRFCADQTRRDELQYFWVDTCCIDKSNSTELSEAINSMFRWYREAAKCYVYLTEVAKPALDAEDTSDKLAWELSFKKSRWFTRGWTLQELIAPTEVEFFSENGELLGTKQSLERHIIEVTRIHVDVLRDNSRLRDFSIHERMSWAETRVTTRGEDKAYSLLGIFGVSLPLIYGEGGEKAFKRLRRAIDEDLRGKSSSLTVVFSCNTLKLITGLGIKRDDFSVTFYSSDIPEIELFIAREEELKEMHLALRAGTGRRTAVLHGLGGIGKTQLAAAYAKQYKDSYSAVFWLNIKDEDSVKQSFSKLAKQILHDHPSASQFNSADTQGNLDELIDGIKAWLNLPNNTHWLMIFDNYDDPRLPGQTDPRKVDISKFLPESYQGSVIITTRSSLVKIGHPMQIKKLEDLSDSLKILSSTSRRKELSNGEYRVISCTHI
jgi:hypothetical protein